MLAVKLRCPACHAESPLEAFGQGDAAREALAVALRLPAPLSSLVIQYLAMFRAPNRALAFDRVHKLLAELHTMLDQGQVTRNGVARAAPLSVWQQGFERMVELRNSNKLQLPLKSHGYLLEVVAAFAEAKRDTQLRSGTRTNHSQDDAQLRKLNARARVNGDFALGKITSDQARELLRRIDAGEDVE